MEKVVYLVLAWVAVGFLVGLVIGKILRQADTAEREPSLPARSL